MKEMRIGHGYDVHKLVEGRRLIIGGVEIPHTLGLLGHSDADVLVHAIMDSILGALGEGDIGKHFPDNDATYKDVSSIHLLTLVKKTLDSHKGRIINVDATLVMQKPKIAPYIDAMRRNIAFALSCEEARINVKATTEEHLGFTGREEGASAHAVALLEVEV
jgi:2-C-methyl-D-erythritol 2,4-cyclodiphosphate synthase